MTRLLLALLVLTVLWAAPMACAFATIGQGT
jgi:hypothetical protein